MFSNRSVSVQPSAPPIEYAGRPDCVERLGRGEEVVPRLRRLDAGLLECGDVVPDGRLVGRLEEQAVGRAVDRADVEDRLAEVLRDLIRDEVDRLERPALREVGHDARLRETRHLGRIAALDRSREDGDDVVAAGGVGDRGVRVLLLERVDHGLEELLLVTGPHAGERDRAGDGLRRRFRGGRPSGFVVVAATCSDEEQEGEHQSEEGQALALHESPFVPS